MKKFLTSGAISIGLALFSMFFGAGNVIFPLAVGQYAGDKNVYATCGLILSAALMPIAGVIAMILFEGDTKRFFGRLGRIPGFWLSLIVITLLGPLGSAPRCIALAYTTLSNSFLSLSPVLFSALACVLIFLFTVRKRHILTLLGWILTPMLLLSLLAIIVLGLIAPKSALPVAETKGALFFHGLKEGYNTMDLLAAFFFSSTILNVLRKRTGETQLSSQTVRTALQAGLVGSTLLALVYVGFSTLASFHGGQLLSISKDQLLSQLALNIGGPYAGVLVCSAIGLACLTTAIALISAFADFAQKEIFRDRISYENTLALSLLATFCVASFQFTGISAFLGPILEICYPGLIVLTFLNILNRTRQFEPIKTPVFCAFGIGALFYLF